MGGFAAFGAQGVGLYRTEYLWLERDTEPTEGEQTAAYSEAVRSAASMGENARVVFRALDLGGDVVNAARVDGEVRRGESFSWKQIHPLAADAPRGLPYAGAGDSARECGGTFRDHVADDCHGA